MFSAKEILRQFSWLNWHVTASGIPGFTANNNSNETFNRDAKRGEKIKSDSVGVYMTETMPRCLRNWSMELGTQIGPIVNSIEGLPNPYVIQKALSIVTHGFDYQENHAVCNYYKVTGMSIHAIVKRGDIHLSVLMWSQPYI